MRPHVGKAGRELRAYLSFFDIPVSSIRLTNLCREFVPPDERLTPDQIRQWEPDLLAEIERTRPRLIIPIGADPVRFFLGQTAALGTVHGIPHRPGALDSAIAYRAPADTCILPAFQPAAGFHSSDTRALIHFDFSQVARVAELIRSGREHEIDYRVDPFSGQAKYYDVSGRTLRQILRSGAYRSSPPPLIALDTEGTPPDPFSVQVTIEPGTGHLLRVDRSDFGDGIAAIQECANLGSILTGHNIGMYDLAMFRVMGLDLFHAHVHDTLFDAFLFCLEPLGLKANAWRHLGLRMRSHAETVGGLSKDLQIDYLRRALTLSADWPKPEPVFSIEGDGQVKVKQPATLASRIRKILYDIETENAGEDDEDADDDGGDTGSADEEKVEGVDPFKRWRLVKRDLALTVKRVEGEIGKMPVGTMRLLYARDPAAATQYSCMDTDAPYRLYAPFTERLEREGKTHLAAVYSSNMHVFSEMQENGMPTSRLKLESLRDRMTAGMLAIGAEISHKYNDGQPINPKSSPQVGKLFDRWGLRGTKKTKGGAASYGKKSIEHLKFIDDHMSEDERFRRELVVLLFKWREHQHTRDMFCTPILDLLPEGVDECAARGQIMPWGTQTGRNSMKRPNLLAQPKHSIYGKWIRECYEAPEGYVFLESDLASIEVCVMAHESGDPDLIRILESGVKFHKVTRERMFGTPFSVSTEAEADNGQYTVSKRIIFGTFFGQTGQGLQEQLWMQNLTQYDADYCQSLIDDVKQKIYPGIGRYEKRVERELRYGKQGKPDKHGKPGPDAGRISDMGGLERYLPGIWSEDRGTQQEAVRHGMSQKIQGGAQRLIQNAIAWLKDEVRGLREELGIDVRWRLTIHDSLLLTCPEWAKEIVQEKIEEGLTQHCGIKLRVPVKAESKTARNWGGL